MDREFHAEMLEIAADVKRDGYLRIMAIVGFVALSVMVLDILDRATA